VADSNLYNSPFHQKIASKVIDLMMINLSAGLAVIRINDNIFNAKVGDNIAGYIIRKIHKDSILVGQNGLDDELLKLNYLTQNTYKEKNENK
jgi:hypothetical protein